MNRSIKNHALILTPALLMLAAGSAANAQFVFSPTCLTNNWYQECSGAACGGGGFQTFNNWGQFACAGGLPTPGPGSTATISATCVLNGSASVANILSSPGTLFTIGGSLAVGNPCTIVGTWNFAGGSNTVEGTYNNSGTTLWTVGFGTTLTNFNFTNNGVLDFQSRGFSQGGGGSTFVNNADMLKTTGSDVVINAIPVVNNDLLSVQGGRLFLDNTSVTGASGSTFETPGGQLWFRNSTVRGTFSGSATGLWRLENAVFDQDSTVNVTGTGVDINGSLTIASGKTLLNSALLKNIQGNNGFAGDIDNAATFTHDTGWTTTLTNAILVNLPGGLLDLRSRTLNQGGGSSVVNQGNVIKSSNSDVVFASLPYSSSALTRIDAGRLFLDNTSVTGLPGSTWSTVGGQLQFRSTTLRGQLSGTAGGLWRIENCSFDNDSTLSISGLGVDINGSLAVASGKTLSNTGILNNINGNNSFAGTIINTGTFSHGTGWTTSLNGCTLNNAVGGTVNLVSRTFTNGGNSPSVINNGTMVKSSGSDVVFNSLPIQQNALCRTDDGRTLFDSCTVTSGNAAAWDITGGQLQFRGSTLRGPLAGANSGFMRIENCTFDQPSSLNVTGNPLDINGVLVNTSGTPIVNNGALINTQGNNTFTGDITNNGLFTHGTGWSTSLVNSVLLNSTSGTLELSSRTFNNGGNSSIVNNGQLTKNSTSTVAINNLPFTNTASIDVTSGALAFNSSPQLTSTPAASWDVTAGQLVWNLSILRGTFNGTNAGTVNLNNCTFDQNSTINITGNPLDISGNLTVASGATLTNAGLAQNIAGNNTFTGNVSNAGTMVHDTGWSTSIDAGTLTNISTMTIRNRTFNGNGSIVNSGLINKTTSPDSSINIPVNNSGQIIAAQGRLFLNGALTLQPSGTITANSQIFLPAAYAHTQGRIEGTGLIGSTSTLVASGGLIAPGAGDGNIGTLAMNGNLDMETGGVLRIDIAGQNANQADRLNLVDGFPRGRAILDGQGTVQVQRVGGYIPTPGHRWTIMTFRERQGQFANVVAVNPTPGRGYRLLYTNTSIDLLTLTGCGIADIGSQGGVAGGDGILDNNDFIVFIDAFFNQDALADVGAQGAVPTADGLFNNNDFIVYIDAFFFGCAN